MRTHAFLDVPDTSPTFYALCAVLLLELLALGPLRNYADRPETLPPTVVACRHSTNLFAFGSKAQWDAALTNCADIYWIGTNHP